MNKGEGSVPTDCSVCLQFPIYPVKLPCDHIYCYLCLKGVASRSRSCPLCRKEIPLDYFKNPLVIVESNKHSTTNHNLPSTSDCDECCTSSSGDGTGVFTWFYEGKHGWWQYDTRTSTEMEVKYDESNTQIIELLIAGFVYIIDFKLMVQYRRDTPGRKRMIKRDAMSAIKVGVAGLTIDQLEMTCISDKQSEESENGSVKCCHENDVSQSVDSDSIDHLNINGLSLSTDD